MPYTYQQRGELDCGNRMYQPVDGLPSKSSTILSAHLFHIPFQCFLTIRPLTIGTAISYPQLRAVVKKFASECGKHCRAPLSYAIGFETRPCLHCHLCGASGVQLDVEWIREYFKAMPVSIDLRAYDRSLNGLAYSLKAADDPDSEWDIVNFDYYLPGKLNRKQRKRLARHQERLAF